MTHRYKESSEKSELRLFAFSASIYRHLNLAHSLVPFSIAKLYQKNSVWSSARYKYRLIQAIYKFNHLIINDYIIFYFAVNIDYNINL